MYERDPQPSGRAQGAPETVSGSAAHVLVVEDDAPVREIVVQVLRGQGFDVTAVESGPAALSHIESGAPLDLLVSDVMMPDMSGPALVEVVARARPQLRVLFLSGGHQEATALEAGCSARVAFLQKPFTFSELLETTRELLRRPPCP